ncbi:MAG: hypothetical protein ACLRS8_02895 [Parabacteroides merdae]
MGMSGNKSALPDNQNHPVLPIFIAVFREKGSVFFFGIFHAISGFWCGCPGCSNLFERISGFFLSLPPIKYQENYEIFRHECMLRLKN